MMSILPSGSLVNSLRWSSGFFTTVWAISHNPVYQKCCGARTMLLCHQPLQEIHPGKRLINHGRSIGVGACCRRSTGRRQAVYEARSKVPQGKIAAEGALKQIGRA